MTPTGRACWLLLVGVGCREYHEPAPFVDCQPYALECDTCSYDADVDVAEGLRRAYRCETADGVAYDAVLRDGDQSEATDDIHYYDPDAGYRLAAERRHGSDVDVCGRDLDVEWWGEILDDCEIVCELDAGLPEADGSLPLCD